MAATLSGVRLVTQTQHHSAGPGGGVSGDGQYHITASYVMLMEIVSAIEWRYNSDGKSGAWYMCIKEALDELKAIKTVNVSLALQQ